jgi:hypothetical protein
MRNIFLIAAIALVSLSSCEKVVNIDLNNSSPQYVIEGSIYEGDNPVDISIARTTDYYGNGSQEKINNARVSILSGDGVITEIPLVSDGKYHIEQFTASTGSVYELRVMVDGKTYTSVARMPLHVELDSLSFKYEEEDLQDAGYRLVTSLRDPGTIKNNYRLFTTVNDTLQNKPEEMFLFNDKYIDGKAVNLDYYLKRFKGGEKIQVELRGMDDSVYQYFSTLKDILNNHNGPAPSNPVSNIKGGALGYFGAFTVSRKMITLPSQTD